MTTAPTSLLETDLGDLTLTELSDFLPAGSELPLELDVPWEGLGQAASLQTSDVISVLADASVASPRTPAASLEVPPASPASEPSNPVASPRADAASSPAASPRASSPSADAQVSEESKEEREDWEYDDDTDPYAAVNLIRASQTITDRPELPEPPVRHPSTNWINHFDPEAPVDTDAVYFVRRLIDRHGEPPHVSFLVEWECKPCQLSWEWPENLKHVYWCMDQVNTWKAAGTDLPFLTYFRRSFRGAGASDTNLCFLYAFQAACFGLGRTGLVNSDHWKRFCVQQGNEFPNGVLTRDIDAFFNFLRADDVSLDYVELFKVYQKRSMWSVEEMERVVRELPQGYYIAHAAQHAVEHCFTVVVQGPSAPVQIFDDYKEGESPPCRLEPLSKLEWLTVVCALYRVALPRPKRSKKPKKKSSKKSKVSRN